ncbi:hypothetical protein EVAR_36117_1 [Eumeta japonica]|uniref:Uncharacterized protein n=1 Tax=Eumeta variegata TaxID=151549 RepID=A0A4C1X5I3_EUMVA|nr:hypothetical protein EVAR_36117_1 [Eumeta japonica]
MIKNAHKKCWPTGESKSISAAFEHDLIKWARRSLHIITVPVNDLKLEDANVSRASVCCARADRSSIFFDIIFLENPNARAQAGSRRAVGGRARTRDTLTFQYESLWLRTTSQKYATFLHENRTPTTKSRHKRMCRGRPRYNITIDGNLKASSYIFIHSTSLYCRCAVDIHGNSITVKMVKEPNVDICSDRRNFVFAPGNATKTLKTTLLKLRSSRSHHGIIAGEINVEHINLAVAVVIRYSIAHSYEAYRSCTLRMRADLFRDSFLCAPYPRRLQLAVVPNLSSSGHCRGIANLGGARAPAGRCPLSRRYEADAAISPRADSVDSARL